MKPSFERVKTMFCGRTKVQDVCGGAGGFAPVLKDGISIMTTSARVLYFACLMPLQESSR